MVQMPCHKLFIYLAILGNIGLRVKSFPILPDLAQSISISSYDHFCSSFRRSKQEVNTCTFGVAWKLKQFCVRNFAKIAKFSFRILNFTKEIKRFKILNSLSLILNDNDFVRHTYIFLVYDPFFQPYHVDTYGPNTNFFFNLRNNARGCTGHMIIPSQAFLLGQ